MRDHVVNVGRVSHCTPVRVSQRGFTLLEMAMVVAIVGILAAMAGPNLIRMRDQLRTKSATMDLSGMLRLGRSAALQTAKPHALVILLGNATTAKDDRAALIECPLGTSAAFNFSAFTSQQLDGKTPLPAGFTIVRALPSDAATRSVGFGAGSQTQIPMYFPYASVPHATGCTFCGGDRGVILFQSDGKLVFSSGAGVVNAWAGSLSISAEKDWPTPAKGKIYTISAIAATGEIRVWQ